MTKDLPIGVDEETKGIYVQLFVSITVMRLVVEYIYRTQICVVYNYNGYSNDFSFPAFVVSIILMYSFIPFMVRCVKYPSISRVILFLIYLLSFVPGTIFMAYTRLPFGLIWYLYYLLLFVLGASLPVDNAVDAEHAYLNKASIYLLIAFFSVFVLFVWIVYAHGRVQINLFDVYSSRMEAREYGLPMFIRYIFASMKIVLPIFVVWALKNKNYWIAGLFAIIQMIIFFTDGSKSTLFSLVASILGYVFLKKNERRILAFPWFISGLGLMSIAEYGLRKTFLISGIVFRRVMFVPQKLNIYFFDFFSQNVPDYFRSSLLKSFGFTSPYGTVARMIGKVYGGSDTLAANNGLFSDAFANLGYAGILIMPIAIILLLRALDEASNELDLCSVFGAVVPLTVAIISASYFSLFLSHGVIAVILLLYFIPRQIDGLPKESDI